MRSGNQKHRTSLGKSTEVLPRKYGSLHQRRPVFSISGTRSLKLIRRALKTLHMRTCESIICDNRPLSLCHEPLDAPSEKAPKEPQALLRLYAAAASMTFIESPKRPL